MIHLMGNLNTLVGNFPIQSQEAVNHYISSCLIDKTQEKDFAYPGDRFPYGDCWQILFSWLGGDSLGLLTTAGLPAGETIE